MNSDIGGAEFTWNGRKFLRAAVAHGDNRGRTFTVAQPLAGRYRIQNFFASGGMGLVLEGLDLRTEGRVLIKAILGYDVVPYARVRDQEGFTSQLRLPRKTLEMERRILVLLRNGGCNAVPHPNDFVYDTNPHLAGPYATDDRGEWTYDDAEMINAEPYLIMEAAHGRPLEEVLRDAPGHRLSEARSLRIIGQVVDVLTALHKPRPMKPGMTWQLIYQDLKPANLLVSSQDRVTVIDLGGCQLINRDTGQKLLPGAATSGYCPPECEQPYTLLSPAADVYTVGTNLFQLLSGRAPTEFLGSNLGKSQARTVHLDLKFLDGHCRPDVKQLIERCLESDPAKRFADGAALQRAIQKVSLAR